MRALGASGDNGLPLVRREVIAFCVGSFDVGGGEIFYRTSECAAIVHNLRRPIVIERSETYR